MTSREAAQLVWRTRPHLRQGEGEPRRSGPGPGSRSRRSPGRRAGPDPGLLDALDRVGALNWLTPEEWNGAYFLGLEVLFGEGLRLTLPEQLAVGVRRLLDAGYRFALLDCRPLGALVPHRPVLRPAAHNRAARQLGEGTFDDFGRAREALAWLRAAVPNLDTRWLEDLIDGLQTAELEGRLQGLLARPDPWVRGRA